MCSEMFNLVVCVHAHEPIRVLIVKMISIFRARRSYIDDLKKGVCLEMKSMLCSYSTGNSVGSLQFVWKIPDSGDMTAGNAKAIRVIEPALPIFHTRAIRKQFFDDFSLFHCSAGCFERDV